MRKKKWIKWIVLLVLIVVIAAWLTFFSQKTQSAAYTEITVTTGELTTYYNFDGLVKASRSQTITAAAADTVKTVYVSQNQRVEKDDKLYRTEGGETVRAGMAGELTGLYVHEGDVLAPGTVTAEIIDMEQLEVQLSVDEYDVAAMTPGQSVEVTVLALGSTVEGFVSALNKNGTASGDLSYYIATVELPETEGVYPGMQVSAKVRSGHVENATILKMDALQFDGYNQPYVFVPAADGKEPNQVAVKVGMSDGVYCEITEGLRAGDTVLVPNGLSMAEIMEQMSAQRSSK